jgi:hypothetical protein
MSWQQLLEMSTEEPFSNKVKMDAITSKDK